MTATLDRPAVPRVADRSAAQTSPLGPGLFAAIWAAGAGLVTFGIPVLLTWATDARSGSGARDATQAVGQLWLLAHGTGITVPGGSVDVLPLGLALVPLALLHRAGRHGARSLGVTTAPQAIRLLVAIAFPYAALAAVVAALATGDTIRPAPVQAMLGGLAIGTVGACTGVLREGQLLKGLATALPRPVRTLLRGSALAVAALLGGGALLSGFAFMRHYERAATLAGASDPGLIGGVALLVVGLALVPNAAVWGAGWLAGPGFVVGVGTSVGPFGTQLGAVPALPLFAALPSAPAPTWLGVFALGVPLAAGALAGVAVARRLTGTPGRAALEAGLVGPCAGALMALLAWLSGGPIGGGRMSQVGPSWWQVGLAVSAEIGCAAAAAAAVVRRP